MTGGKDASLSAYFSTKRLIEGAISVQVDQGDPILIAHPKCDGLICAGRVQIDDEVVERLKHSKMITIEATDTAHQKNSLSFSLADFAKTYDGPSAPLPNVVEETQENLKKELAKREEEQKKLQCQE
jgi:invasion protein IalB